MPQQPPAALPLGGLPAEWLDAIRNRHAAAEGGHWHLDPEPHKDRDTVRTTISGYHRRIGVLKFNAPYADENRRFVLNAHGDVALLLAELDRLTAELEKARSSAFREAARLLESTSRDGDAVNLLDNVADGITTHTLNPAAVFGA